MDDGIIIYGMDGSPITGTDSSIISIAEWPVMIGRLGILIPQDDLGKFDPDGEWVVSWDGTERARVKDLDKRLFEMLMGALPPEGE